MNTLLPASPRSQEPALESLLRPFARLVAEELAKVLGQVKSPKPLLTTREAAAMLGVGRSQVDIMIAREELLCVRNGRRKLVSAQSVEDWIAARLPATPDKVSTIRPRQKR